jgi:hypothetical protein
MKKSFNVLDRLGAELFIIERVQDAADGGGDGFNGYLPGMLLYSPCEVVGLSRIYSEDSANQAHFIAWLHAQLPKVGPHVLPTALGTTSRTRQRVQVVLCLVLPVLDLFCWQQPKKLGWLERFGYHGRVEAVIELTEVDYN